MPRLVCLSDTHGLHDHLDGPFAVPEGDVLVFAGDACTSGTPGEWASFCTWFAGLPHPHKVVVAGNHDWPVQPSVPAWGVSARYGPATIRYARRRLESAGVVFLDRCDATVAGLRFWGSPWVPAFHNWAFNLPRGSERLAEIWSRIPPGLDVLVTHAPAFGVLDRTASGDHAGCERLAERFQALGSEAPRLHVHGDIHEAAGVVAPPLGAEGRISVNASVLDVKYQLANAPVAVDL